MTNGRLRKLGLVAVVLFAPGGFVLGAALAADTLRRRVRKRAAGGADKRSRQRYGARARRVADWG